MIETRRLKNVVSFLLPIHNAFCFLQTFEASLVLDNVSTVIDLAHLFNESITKLHIKFSQKNKIIIIS